MKIIDIYILKQFVTTFFSVFVILFFIFILQTVWLYIPELAGKGLDFFMILKFLGFASPKLVTMVLPITILLSSIMTFGDLAENYEFAAMKSAGISFQRTMQGLTVFIVFIAIIAFLFSNNVIPYSEFKFTNFRKNIAQQKPAMAITEGKFNNLGNINIKVNKKSGDNDQFLEGVIMHKKSSMGEGAKTVIKSEKGELVSNNTSNILQLVLQNGYYYEDITPKNWQDRKKVPFAKVFFKQYTINIDLSKFTSNINDQKEDITNNSNMLNLKELQYSVDSLQTTYNKEVYAIADNTYNRLGINYTAQLDTIKPKIVKPTFNLIKILSNGDKARVYEIALSESISNQSNIQYNDLSLAFKRKDINNHWISIHEKFVISISCIFMFFIGAPLGAIIRKGGLGLPIVFAMIIFIIFHFLNTFGRKLAQESGITPFLGAWNSSFLLIPLSIFLTLKAKNDSGAVNFDVITEPFQKIVLNITNKLKKNNI